MSGKDKDEEAVVEEELGQFRQKISKEEIDKLEEELKGARYTSEEDEGFDEDEVEIGVKIGRLQLALLLRKARLQEEEGDDPVTMRRRRAREALEYAKAIDFKGEKLSAVEQEAFNHGIDFSVLRQIKESFDTPDDGDKTSENGVTEDDFWKDFGPTLCPGMSEEKFRLWFRTVDANCSGTVSWGEVSNFLVHRKQDRKGRVKLFVPSTVEPEPYPLTTLGTNRRRHKLPITSIAYSNNLDRFYTGSTDGMVHCWNPTTMHSLADPIHRTNSWVNSLVYLPHNNRLAVLQADRSIFVYDTFTQKGELRHTLYRTFATSGKAVRRDADGSVFYENRTITSDRVRKSKQKDNSMNSNISVTLLAASEDGIMSMDHLGGATTGEPVVVGLESGTLETMNLLHGSSRPIKPQAKIKVHNDWITQVRYTPELSGVITSSLDETAAVVDLEKNVVVQRMGGDLRKKKPLFNFDYHRFHNVLTTSCGRNVHIWNALTGAKLMTLPEHDAPVVRTSINASKWHLYALTEDKTVKVWDLRVYRPLSEVRDETPRYPSDSLSILHWSDRHHMLFTGCTELFGWRPVEVQERLDAGLTATSKGFNGHLRPINHTILLDAAMHLVSIDAEVTIVWGCREGEKLADWRWALNEDGQDRITCCTMDLAGVRMLAGTERGKLYWLNYATGLVLSQMFHQEGNLEVSSVKVVPGVTSDAPPMAYAGAGSAVLMWTVDRNNEKDILAPSAHYRVRSNHGLVLAVEMADEDRQVVVVSCSNGFYLLLTLNLAPLSQLGTSVVPAELLYVIAPGVFFGCHADGVIRLMGISSQSYDFYELCSFSGCQENEDPITAICVHDNRIYIGDAGGYVSIFEAKKLLDLKNVRYTLIPHAANGDNETAMQALDDMNLIMSFRGHRGTVTGIGIQDNILFTASTDRQIRSWEGLGIGQCTREFGRAKPIEGLQRLVETSKHSFNLANSVVMSEGHIKTATRALSFANNLLVAQRRATASRFPSLMKKPSMGSFGFLESSQHSMDLGSGSGSSSPVSSPKAVSPHTRKVTLATLGGALFQPTGAAQPTAKKAATPTPTAESAETTLPPLPKRSKSVVVTEPLSALPRVSSCEALSSRKETQRRDSFARSQSMPRDISPSRRLNDDDHFFGLVAKPLTYVSKSKKEEHSPVPYVSKVQTSLLEVAHVKHRRHGEFGGVGMMKEVPRTFTGVPLSGVKTMKDLTKIKKGVETTYEYE